MDVPGRIASSIQPELVITAKGEIVAKGTSWGRCFTARLRGDQEITAKALNKFSQKQFEAMQTSLLSDQDPAKFDAFLQHVSRVAPQLSATALKSLVTLIGHVNQEITADRSDNQYKTQISIQAKLLALCDSKMLEDLESGHATAHTLNRLSRDQMKLIQNHFSRQDPAKFDVFLKHLSAASTELSSDTLSHLATVISEVQRNRVSEPTERQLQTQVQVQGDLLRLIEQKQAEEAKELLMQVVNARVFNQKPVAEQQTLRAQLRSRLLARSESTNAASFNADLDNTLVKLGAIKSPDELPFDAKAGLEMKDRLLKETGVLTRKSSEVLSFGEQNGAAKNTFERATAHIPNFLKGLQSQVSKFFELPDASSDAEVYEFTSTPLTEDEQKQEVLSKTLTRSLLADAALEGSPVLMECSIPNAITKLYQKAFAAGLDVPEKIRGLEVKGDPVVAKKETQATKSFSFTRNTFYHQPGTTDVYLYQITSTLTQDKEHPERITPEVTHTWQKVL